MEIISVDGLRNDGRRPNEIRRTRTRLGLLENADGSSYFEQGNTRALVAVYGPKEAEIKQKVRHDGAFINCEFSLSSFATADGRRQRKSDRTSLELKSNIEQSFESVVLTKLYPRSQIDVFIQVLQSDGGQMAVILNAVTMALINAGIAMKDFVCACTCSIYEDEYYLDVNSLEAPFVESSLTLAVVPKTSKVVFMQTESKMPSITTLEKAIEVGTHGCHQIYEILESEARAHTLSLVASKSLL